MNAKQLPPGKHRALKRITAEKKARDWRAFKRDMSAFAVITACALVIAAAVLVTLCALMGLPL